MSVPLFFNLLPTRTRIVSLDTRCDAGRLPPEIALVHHARVTDDEGLDAGDTILRRGRDHAEAADQTPANDVVHLAAGRVRPLPLQQSEDIAVIWRRLVVGAADHAARRAAASGPSGLGDSPGSVAQ